MINWQEQIDKYVENKRTTFKPPVKSVFRASELSGCLRQCTLNRVGLKKFPVSVLRNFEIGTQLHLFLQEKVGKDLQCEYERQVEFDFKTPRGTIKITGHVDAFDGEIVYDFKSIKGFTFVSHGNISKGYIFQLHAYMFALNVDKAVLVYVDKNTWDVKPLDIEFNTETMAELIEFCHDVDEAVETYNASGVLPAADKCFACKCEVEEVKVLNG